MIRSRMTPPTRPCFCGAGRSLADVADPDVGMALLDSADIAAAFTDNSVEDVSSVPNATVYEWHSKNRCL